MPDGATIERLGWKQGVLLHPELAQHLVAIGAPQAPAPEGSLHAVVSQSCDVVHGDFEAEPWCEVVRLQRIPTLDPAYEHGKHPRLLHFNISDTGTMAPYAIASKDRFFLKRELLSSHTPCTNPEIPEATRTLVADWLAKRYNRPALPTAFNKRLKASSKLYRKLKSLVEKYHWLFRDFYLNLRPFDEITDPEAKYRVELLLVAPEEAFARSGTELDSFRRQLEENLKQCAGIVVADMRLLPDTRTSLRLLDDYVPWDDFDYLTPRDDAAEPAPATPTG